MWELLGCMKTSELKASATEGFLCLWHINSVGSRSANSVYTVFSGTLPLSEWQERAASSPIFCLHVEAAEMLHLFI